MIDLKILVVADGADAEAAHKSLDSAGLQFQTAYSTEEALIKGKVCQPDVYFLDESYYRIGSLHLQRLRQISKRAAIYVMTANASDFAENANNDEGSVGIMGLEKPMDMAQVGAELDGFSKLKVLRNEDHAEASDSMKILVVEKSASIGKFIARAIAKRWENTEFWFEQDGYKGLQNIKHSGVKYNLVVSDLELPGLSGEEMLLVANAEGHLKDTPVLVLSGRVTPDLRKEFSEFNIGFLRKPAVPDQILAGMQMVLSAAKIAKISAA